MLRSVRIMIISGFLYYFYGCSPQEERIYHDELIAFGTLVNFTLYGVEETLAAAAVSDVASMFERQHKDWHAWQKGQLTSLNEAISAGSSMHVDLSIIELIRLGQSFERDSKGLFNPAIGNLLRLWGFQQDEAAVPPPPSAEIIQAWLSSKPSLLDLDINGQTVRSTNTNVSLDFGGFAKGYSVGKAVHLIESYGINNFIVNAGGDLCVKGRHGDRPWIIGIRHPDGTGLLASIALEESSCVFTSGSYERYFEYQGHRYHHILDPRSGYPATHSVSVTVLTKDPTLADAAATAIFIAGPQQFVSIAAHMGIEEVLLIDNNNNAYITPGLRKLINFEQEPASIKTVRIGNRVYGKHAESAFSG